MKEGSRPTVVGNDRDMWVLQEDIKLKVLAWLRRRENLLHLNGEKFANFINDDFLPRHMTGGGGSAALALVALQKELNIWHLLYPMCVYTCTRWLHVLGGCFCEKTQTYTCDSHENFQEDRNEYIKRDQGSATEPSDRELCQYQWIQMPAAAAKLVFARHDDEGAATLRKGAFFYTAPEAPSVSSKGVAKALPVIPSRSPCAAATTTAATTTAAATAAAATTNTAATATSAAASAAATAPAAAAAATVATTATAAAATGKTWAGESCRGSRAGLSGGGGVQMVEFHVESSDAFDEWRETQFMGGGLSVRMPFGTRPLIVSGQDEAIFNSEATSKRVWVIEDVSALTLKTGSGCMVSAYQSNVCGFGLPMTAEQLDAVNKDRVEHDTYVCGKFGAPQTLCRLGGLPETDKKPLLKESPGVRIIHHGASKDGYWTFAHMMVQAEDYSDCLKVLYPWCRFLDEYDNSRSHAVKKPDGLDASRMAKGFGGAQTPKRDSVMMAGCLGPHPAVVIRGGGGARPEAQRRRHSVHGVSRRRPTTIQQAHLPKARLRHGAD